MHVVGRTQEDAGQEQQLHQAGAGGPGEQGHPGAEQGHNTWAPSSSARVKVKVKVNSPLLPKPKSWSCPRSPSLQREPRSTREPII